MVLLPKAPRALFAVKKPLTELGSYPVLGDCVGLCLPEVPFVRPTGYAPDLGGGSSAFVILCPSRQV